MFNGKNHFPLPCKDGSFSSGIPAITFNFSISVTQAASLFLGCMKKLALLGASLKHGEKSACKFLY
jgi:hypothetical protein